MKKRIVTLIMLFVLVLLFNSTLSQVEANSEFTDLPKSDVHYEAVMELVEREIFTGYGDGIFSPYESISRQHVAVLLTRALELQVPTNIGRVLSGYDDVNSDHYYAEEIAAVTAAGIFKGNNRKFNPNHSITREQMATVLYKGFDLDKYHASHVSINLRNVDSSHRNGVQAFANHGITKTLSNFNPGQDLSRAQFASFLYRTMNVVEEKNLTYGVAVLEFVNEARTKEGLGALQLDSELTAFARFRANDMAVNDYFSHDSPIHGSFEQMVRNHDLMKRSPVGENIAMGYRTPEAVVDGWMNSPGHRANILSGNFRYMGLAYDERGHYWVQVFGGR